MCGICGIIQVGGVPREVVDPDRLDVMTDAMRHRGPDDRGVVSRPGFAFGARRLSIVDVEGGHQPVESEDGTVVAMQNGEIYNHVSLRAELSADGHRFASRCDTEVLPHLYERDGLAMVERLRGKFALGVWDGRRRRALLARDRLGVKPLYWARANDLVVFASELKSVLASGLVSTELDLAALDLFMTLGYIPGPRTPLLAVHKLSPGAMLVVEDGHVREAPYWDYPPPQPDAVPRSLDDYADELLDLLRNAVRDRLMSDVPLGAMLSGGLDSSLVVALMAGELDRPVDTFSVGFRDDPANELEDARIVAAHFACRHHELELTATDSLLDLDELVWHLDEPIADLSTLGFDTLSRLASEHVVVALAGQGADELFGGYPKHVAAAAVRRLAWLPDVARRRIERLPVPSGNARRLLRAVGSPDAPSRLLAFSGRMTASDRRRLLRGPIDEDLALATIASAQAGVDGDPLGITLYLDAKLALVDHMLLYFDKCSMAHSLEVRVPYLDHRLVEWAASVPSEMKVDGRVTKRVLRRAAAGLVPTVSMRKRKVGFLRFALQPWLAEQLAGQAGQRLHDPDAAYREVLSPEAVLAIVDGYRRRPSEDGARTVFAILVLDSWLSSFRRRALPD
jgi:asparagine synthase (glutamine-hydrolysing)